MTPVFERVAILGLGLLGGSVARASRARGAARVIAGATRRRDALDAARSAGVLDEVGEPEEVVRNADLVILATPVFAMEGLLRRLAPQLREGAIVTDVGSVKRVLHETLPGLLPRGVHYIGSHPMAGSHERGFSHSSADLFADAPCVVTQTAPSPELDRLCAFWRKLGARVHLRDPADHDVEVAWMSHVPHVLAYAFADALAAAPTAAREVAGAGFRDFTRIARSEPELWGDILTANRKALSAPLQAAGEALARMARAIEANDSDALERTIAAARDTLAHYPQRTKPLAAERMQDESDEGHSTRNEP
jgi:cyclohexadieny/prephenate dehydrogenase